MSATPRALTYPLNLLTPGARSHHPQPYDVAPVGEARMDHGARMHHRGGDAREAGALAPAGPVGRDHALARRLRAGGEGEETPPTLNGSLHCHS